MKGDFARVTFDPGLHYSQVFQQQGRVLLEADWNEQASIQLYLMRAFIADLVGSCWAAGDGFALTSKPQLANWQLSPGHFYVDGILCVNEAFCTLAAQPHAPTPEYDANGGDFANPPATYALWLDVWERHLSWVEAPRINDTALDGVDTASRAQVVWQIRMIDQARLGRQLDAVTAALTVRQKAAEDNGDDADIEQALKDIETLRSHVDGRAAANDDPCTFLRQALGARGTYAWPRLRAQLGPAATDDDPCVIAADARYRGCENQLYRVEVHQGSVIAATGVASNATFKWSRENGSVIFPVVDSVTATAPDGTPHVTVTLANAGRDRRLGLKVDDWVELLDDDDTLGQRAYPLLQVLAIDPGQHSVTLGGAKGGQPHVPGSVPGKHPLLRRWDQREQLTVDGLVAIAEGDWVALEDGVEVFFEVGGVYVTGDYWIIPARVAGNGTLDWPAGTVAVRSRGMHHFAVLGTTNANGAFGECCCRFDSLCELIRTDPTRRLAVDAAPVLQPKAATKTVKTAKTAKAAKATKKKKPGG
jgi:Family of unknown function (DUF6519)